MPLWGPFIKDVIKFFGIFDPLPLVRIFTCGHAGLYVGRVSSSPNELTFWSAVETLVSHEKCDHM